MNREEIIADNPLLAYCEARGWQLKRDRAQWKCLCPLHAEQTPSFVINPAKNVWKCFGCGAGGSVIDLHAQLHGITIGEAMRQLAGPDGGNASNGEGKERKVESRRPANTASARSESAAPGSRRLRLPGRHRPGHLPGGALRTEGLPPMPDR
jgi:hypothetical protein